MNEAMAEADRRAWADVHEMQAADRLAAGKARPTGEHRRAELTFRDRDGGVAVPGPIDLSEVLEPKVFLDADVLNVVSGGGRINAPALVTDLLLAGYRIVKGEQVVCWAGEWEPPWAQATDPDGECGDYSGIHEDGSPVVCTRWRHDPADPHYNHGLQLDWPDGGRIDLDEESEESRDESGSRFPTRVDDGPYNEHDPSMVEFGGDR